MNIISQKGGIKSPGIYFIFYSSEDHNFNTIFGKDKNKEPFQRFYTFKSLDNILQFFFKGFYMKNNESKISINILNNTIIKKIISYFLSDDYIIRKVLNKEEINLILINILNELINKKSLSNKNELELQKKLENEINKLIINKDNKDNNKKITKENIKIIKKKKEIIVQKRIIFIKRIIYIYNKKNLNNNEKMKILLGYESINKNKSIILEDTDIVKTKILKNFIYNEKNPNIKELDNHAIIIINSLREKYNIDSYMIVNVFPMSTLGVSNQIIYNKKFNNNNLKPFNNKLYNQIYNDLVNKVTLKHHLGEHAIKYSIVHIFFILVVAKILIMLAIFSNPSGNPSSSSSFFLPHPSDISLFYDQGYLRESDLEKKSTCSCVYKKN